MPHPTREGPQTPCMLDTNALSELVRNPQGTLAQRLGVLDPDWVCTSIVAACELRSGAERKGSARLTQRVEQLLQTLTVLPLDTPAEEHCADIRATLERSGTPIGSHDLFIEAHARSHGMTLLTRNLREFLRVPGLAVEGCRPARLRDADHGGGEQQVQEPCVAQRRAAPFGAHERAWRNASQALQSLPVQQMPHPPRYKSSTSRAERAREQHSSIWSLAARSSGVR